jgi:hypothetical protein
VITPSFKGIIKSSITCLTTCHSWLTSLTSKNLLIIPQIWVQNRIEKLLTSFGFQIQTQTQTWGFILWVELEIIPYTYPSV